jgi:hypothetical protein
LLVTVNAGQFHEAVSRDATGATTVDARSAEMTAGALSSLSLDLSRQDPNDGWPRAFQIGSNHFIDGRVDRMDVADEDMPFLYWRTAYRRFSASGESHM